MQGPLFGCAVELTRPPRANFPAPARGAGWGGGASVQYRREQQRLWDSRPNPHIYGAGFNFQLVRLSAMLQSGMRFSLL